MIVFNAGVPRSGTVLLGAIVRNLFEGQGIAVTQHNPHGPQLPQLMARLSESADEKVGVHLVHTHNWWDGMDQWISDPNRDVTGFLCHRYPRDVCVSLMRLHDQTFEEASNLTLGCYAHFSWMRAETAWPLVDYRDMKTGKQQQIRRIASHLGIQVSNDRVHEIDEATSVERHREIMNRVRDGKVARIIEHHNKRRVLREDADSLINDRHIQSGELGRWRLELTPEQQVKASEIFADYIGLSIE